MTAIASELRKTFTVKLWWALLIPILLVALGANAFGGLFEQLFPDEIPPDRLPSLLPLTLGWTLTQVAVMAVVIGTITAGGEFRHRTITTTYLTASGRGPVLMAKLLVSAMTGALYGGAAALVGSAMGLLAQESKPAAGQLLWIVGVGVAVCALWAVLGAGLGMAMGNQVGALVLALVYLLLVEPAVSLVLSNNENESVARLSGYLPGNAGDVAVLYDPATSLVGDPEVGPRVLQLLTSVYDAPSTGVSLLVLAVWTALVVGLAALFSSLRDIT